ncbi:cation transporter [Trypanosoma grayi]|uniref:cation transporter n=1 Tax=Trypanosoma grayi TaxID=71804 RepID=UPI0004F487B1|nr:cation transporter [Trypanosoma grayi]KEG09503.1 cation transporter [Trypanosoma grayi]
MRRRFLIGLTPMAVRQTVRNHGHGHGHSHSGARSGHHHHHHHRHHHHHQQLDASMKGQHLRQCQLVTAVGGSTNVLFCVAKVWIGSSGGSVALVADGFHALVDLLADVISYAAVTLSMKRLPRCHFPFGIGRIETAGAVLVAFILLFGGVVLLFQSLEECRREIVDRLGLRGDDDEEQHRQHLHQHGDGGNGVHNDHHGHSHFNVKHLDEDGRVTILWAMVWVSVVSIIAKEVLFRWTKRVGERAGSRVVVANAYHHRADAWSGVVALVGVAGHCVGMPGVDGLAGLCVSWSIIRIGYSLLRSSLLEFFDFQSANEVSDVRRELQLQRKSHPVNVFLIRHGHSYALHVTLLVEANTTAATVTAAASELTTLAKRSVAVADTYTTLFVCDKEQEESLRYTLKLVETFHGLNSILFQWEARRLIVPQPLQSECMEDILTIASFFGLKVVSEEGKDAGDAVSDDATTNTTNSATTTASGASEAA